MKISFPTLFSQLDTRWDGKTLGNNTDSKYNIHNYGCLITDLSAIACYYGKKTDPSQMNEDLKKNGGFAVGSGDYVYGSINKIYVDIKERRITTPNALTDAQIGEIKSAIDSLSPVMIQIDYNPKTVALDSHFVVIIAYNGQDENDFTIFDPLGGKIHSLKDYLAAFFPSARKTINQYLIYSGPTPTSVDDDSMVIKKSLFPPLVHGSSQWDQAVHTYIDPSADPSTTDFSALQNVVSGFKSTATGAQNAAAKAQTDLAIANQTITNLNEKIDREEKQFAADISVVQAKLDASGSSSSVLGELQKQIDDLKVSNSQLLQDKHDLSLKLAEATSAPVVITANRGLIESVIAWLQGLLVK